MSFLRLERKYTKETGDNPRYGGQCGCYTTKFVQWIVKKYELEKAKFDAVARIIERNKNVSDTEHSLKS